MTRRPLNLPTRKAATLVELLVAIVVLIVGVWATLQIFGPGLRIKKHASAEQMAFRFAEGEKARLGELPVALVSRNSTTNEVDFSVNSSAKVSDYLYKVSTVIGEKVKASDYVFLRFGHSLRPTQLAYFPDPYEPLPDPGSDVGGNLLPPSDSSSFKPAPTGIPAGDWDCWQYPRRYTSTTTYLAFDDSPRTQLNAGLVTGDTTSMAVDEATNFPDSGVVAIDDEHIAYTSRTDNPSPTPDTLNDLTRGFGGTTPAYHLAGALVRLYKADKPRWFLISYSYLDSSSQVRDVVGKLYSLDSSAALPDNYIIKLEDSTGNVVIPGSETVFRVVGTSLHPPTSFALDYTDTGTINGPGVFDFSGKFRAQDQTPNQVALPLPGETLLADYDIAGHFGRLDITPPGYRRPSGELETILQNVPLPEITWEDHLVPSSFPYEIRLDYKPIEGDSPLTSSCPSYLMAVVKENPTYFVDPGPPPVTRSGRLYPPLSAHLTAPPYFLPAGETGSMRVDEAANFPGSGVVTIDNEQIAYSSRTDNAFPAYDTLNGLTRGMGGTVPADHLGGALVQVVRLGIGTVDYRNGMLRFTPEIGGKWVRVYYRTQRRLIGHAVKSAAEYAIYVPATNPNESSLGLPAIYDATTSQWRVLYQDPSLSKAMRSPKQFWFIPSVGPGQTTLYTPANLTVLTAAASSGDLSLAVADASAFPAQGVVLVDQEQIRYFSHTNTTLDGLTRGINGTTPAPHSAGAVVLCPRRFYEDASVAVDYSYSYNGAQRQIVGEQHQIKDLGGARYGFVLNHPNVTEITSIRGASAKVRVAWRSQMAFDKLKTFEIRADAVWKGSESG